MVAGLLTAVPAPAGAASGQRPAAQQWQSVHGDATKPAHISVHDDAATPWRASSVSWPQAGSGIADLAAGGSATVSGSTAAGVRAGSTAVSVARSSSAGPARVRVDVTSHAAALAAGVNGVLLSAQVSDAAAGAGDVQVGVDYSSFADAFGGGYADRLRLVQLPACALSSPAVPACQVQTPLASTVNPTTHTVSARVTLTAAPVAPANATAPIAPADAAGRIAVSSVALPLNRAAFVSTASAQQPSLVVLATASAPSGSAGDYTATSLKPSGTWTAGGNSGGFSYSYPISVPPVAGSLTPEVGLAYDSQSVDGEQVSTNSQTSWIGDGWSYSPGFIERSFVPCADDPAGTAPKTGDECWLSGAAPLHIDLNGHSGDIVYDSSSGKYKITGDNGEVVSYKTGGNNGTQAGDYFQVTDQSGTQYFFGRNRLPGWVSGQPTTNSAWTTPVYGAHAGDPCYNAAGFAQSSCAQAWRWNLDYVVDTHHNALAYYYQTETNFYGANLGTTAVSYIRGGWLDHIDYGLVDPTPLTGNGGHAPAQVSFAVAERCLPGALEDCSAANITTKPQDWPDTPYDQNCTSGAACNNHSPTFWSRQRLTAITTQIWNGAAYSPADSYSLTQTFPDPGDGTKPALWLASVQHTGKDGTAVSLPAVSFAATKLPNRVDGLDTSPAMNHNRVSTITSETGAVLQVSYSSLAAPCVHPVTISPSANTAQCYPVYWTPSGFSSPQLDWFAKYVVNEIDDQDPTGGAPPVATTYTYLNGAAWHYDDNETVKAKYRSWGQWRGYGLVQTRTGSGSDPKTLSETYFYRGMNGDTLPNNATRTVNVALSTAVSVHGANAALPATSVPDTNQLAGQPREEISYNGDGGPVDHATVSDYWVSGATATRTRTGLPALTSTMTRPVAAYTVNAITQTSPTTWRTTEVDTTYNTSTGLATVVNDYGDITQAAQAKCAVTSYAPANASANLVNLPAEVETDAKPCGGSGVNGLTAPTTLNRPTDVISDTRTFYDDPLFATTWPQTTPTAGDESMTLTASDYISGAFTYLTTAKASFDSFGRRLTAVDANANTTTTTTYTMANGLPSVTAVANALNQTTTTTLDPARGLPTKVVDPNGLATVQAYDGLGRLSGVWLSGMSTTGPANDVFSYLVQQNLPSAVTTQVMNDDGTYRTSVALYDALLRPRQTQTQTPVGGRLLTDTFYDSRGWSFKKNNEYWDAQSGPTTAMLNMVGHDNQIPNQHLYTFDGLGRETLDVGQLLGNPVAGEQTKTVYGGDRTTNIPPTGGSPFTTIVDGRGRTIERDNYTANPTITGNQVSGGSPVKVLYGFDNRGNPSTVTDSTGHSWTSTFNLLGRITRNQDPDTGDTGVNGLQYDNNGNLLHSTDGRGKTITYSYDALNRKTFQYDGATTTSPLIAKWVYDSTTIVNGIGQLAATTSYDPAGGANGYTVATNGYTKLYKPTGTTVTVPSDPANGALAGSYTFTNTYSLTNNLLKKEAFPATTGALPSETVNHTYNGMDMASGVGDLYGDYVDNTTYNQFGLVSQAQLNLGSTNKTWVTKIYDQHTNRLLESDTDRITSPTRLDSVIYTYNPAGMITKLADTHNNTSTETQCFDYGLLGRLSTAWTATDNCVADLGLGGATNATVGDPVGGAYWTSYTYNTVGDRTQAIDHHLPGQTQDTTTTYTYPTGNQPNTLTSTATTGPTGNTSTGYGYDLAGNTTSRTTPTYGAQTLTWNNAGQLAKIVNSAGTSSYSYDADGTTLVQRDPGQVTVYLPGEQLVLNTTSGAITGTRYYTGPGGITAVRTGTAASAYSYLIADNNGTAQLSLNATAQTPTWRQFTPYGATRGTAPGAWPDTHQYLDKPADSATGLDLFGARQYDPSIGRFTSADPVFGPDDPNQIGGYTYTGDDPINSSDPTGNWGFHFHIHINIGNVIKAVANVASIVSMIPGPIGMVAAGVSAVAYAASGDWKQAAMMAGGIALSAVGAGVAAVVASRAVKVAEVASTAIHDADEVANVARETRQAARAAQEASRTTEKEGESGASAAETCGANSFDPSTPIVMANGSRKAIKDVKVGDQVLATDPASGSTTAEPVTDLHDNQDTDLTDLTISTIDAHGRSDTAVVHTTTHHPFWDETTQTWTDAGHLLPGERLHTATGVVATVSAVHSWTGYHDMRNLTVDFLHTFYISTGRAPILVHNCSTRLGRNLGERPEPGDHAHHIVPEGDKLANDAVDILNKHEIGMDSAENGIWLTPQAHYGTYAKSYARWINDEVVAADAKGGKQAVLGFLADTKQALAEMDMYVRKAH